MLSKVRIICVGKNHDSTLSVLISKYEKRMRGKCKFEWVFLKNDVLLESRIRGMEYHCLDPLGSECTSEGFTNILRSKSCWNLVIGGHSGLPSIIRQKAKGLISLSKLTFPHEIVRVLLIEQIYRAIEIDKCSPYHK